MKKDKFVNDILSPCINDLFRIYYKFKEVCNQWGTVDDLDPEKDYELYCLVTRCFEVVELMESDDSVRVDMLSKYVLF